MFLPVNAQQPSIRSAESRISPSDWEVLSKIWFPVALEQEVSDKPVKASLLDVDLVLFRSAGGITAALDRCPHRWVRLSAGSVSEGKLTCAFHGLTFDGTGQCIRVPALGRETKLPASYRVQTFRTEVRYGMVWVCLDGSSEARVPEFEVLAGYHSSALFFNVWLWPMSAARQVENFFDLAHLPFIHASTLGGDPQARLTPPSVEQLEDSLVFRAKYVETVGFEQPTEFEFAYRVYLPFAIDFRTSGPGGLGFKSMNIATPVSAHRCRVFQILLRGSPGERFEDESAPAFPHPDGPGVINQQDIDIMSQLTIGDLPLTEKLEIHLPVDNVSMAYRKRLVALGLGQP